MQGIQVVIPWRSAGSASDWWTKTQRCLSHGCFGLSDSVPPRFISYECPSYLPVFFQASSWCPSELATLNFSPRPGLIHGFPLTGLALQQLQLRFHFAGSWSVKELAAMPLRSIFAKEFFGGNKTWPLKAAPTVPSISSLPLQVAQRVDSSSWWWWIPHHQHPNGRRLGPHFNIFQNTGYDCISNFPDVVSTNVWYLLD